MLLKPRQSNDRSPFLRGPRCRRTRAQIRKKAPKGDKATKENKLAKWLKKKGVMRSLAEIAAKALAPRQMAHFA